MSRTGTVSLIGLLVALVTPHSLFAQESQGTSRFALALTAEEPAQPIRAALTQALATTTAAQTSASRSRIPADFVPLEDMTRRPAPLVPMYAGMIALQAYDAYSTLKAVRNGAVEVNPVAAAALQQPAAFVVMKGVAATGTIYAAERLWRRDRRKSAIALMVVTNGVLAFAAARNASVLRAQR